MQCIRDFDFVQKLLHLSRSSCSIVLVAMCYISAAKTVILRLRKQYASIARAGRSSELSSHPLLDVRRTFLAAISLAWKFLEDKPFSRKLWAKMTRLDASEITGCERALGEALSWRLWVGKPTMPDDDCDGCENTLAEEFLSTAILRT
jgi:hypothetical protein